jgi:hypothetical protein
MVVVVHKRTSMAVHLHRAREGAMKYLKSFFRYVLKLIQGLFHKELVFAAGLTVVGLLGWTADKIPYPGKLEQIGNLVLSIAPGSVYILARCYQKGRSGNPN